jgi:hypothetical protein
MRDEEEVINWNHCWMRLKMWIFTRKFSGILNDLFLTFTTSVSNWQWTK